MNKKDKKVFQSVNEFLEVCSKTGEVRMIGSDKVLEGMRYLPEQGIIKEYRFRPLEDGEDLEDFMSEFEDTLDFEIPVSVAEELIDEALSYGGKVIVHKDGDFSNNCADNLKFVPYTDWKYYYSNPVGVKGEDGDLVDSYPNVAKAAEVYGMEPAELVKELNRKQRQSNRRK